MTIVRTYAAALAISAGIATASGCGLISSNVTDFALMVPGKTFTVDTTTWMVNQTAADTYLDQSCASAPTECAQWVQNACTSGCSGTCDATSQKCDLVLDVSVYTPVNLLNDAPELSTLNSEPIIKVTVNSVNYTVPQNTLDVPTPEMTVYVAPMSVMSPTDPSAQAIGTIAAVPKMTTLTTTQSMQYTATGQQDLANIMGTYKVPFNVIVGSSLTVTAGEQLPTGM